MMDKLIIKKGDKFKTKNRGDAHGGAVLTVKSVTGQTDDDFAVVEASPKIKYKRHYNTFKPRLWWLRGYCVKIN
jgi:hypothetical protein